MKAIQFNYEYFKNNPETKLVFREPTNDNIEFYKEFKNRNGLSFAINNNITFYTYDGKPIIDEKVYHMPSSKDLFMWIPPKEEFFYCNEWIDELGCLMENLEDCTNYRYCKEWERYQPIRVLKLVKVDGLIDFSRVEVVHTY